jgi:hypothetical protein
MPISPDNSVATAQGPSGGDVTPVVPAAIERRRWPEPRAVVQLLKPLTWFAPMWALACGVVSAGVSFERRWPWILGAIALAGPLVCGTSQAANDYFDRHVDAINEPKRPIPSGRIPGRWGLAIAVIWTLVSLAVAGALGPWVFAAAVRRWGRPAVEIEQAALDACEREVNHLRRYRRVFNGIATVGPLLGLLGTVFGLIRSFNDVAGAGAMGRPDLLARGFGEALITTAMGLLVAIPAMVLHWVFTSRVDRLAMRLDETCQQVIDEISLEATAEPPRRKSRPPLAVGA